MNADQIWSFPLSFVVGAHQAIILRRAALRGASTGMLHHIIQKLQPRPFAPLSLPCPKCLKPALFPAQAHQPFLRSAGDKAPILRENLAAIKATRMARPWRVGGIEQPFVRPEFLMQPKRMIEARHLQRIAQPADPVLQRARAQQAHIRSIG